jgi:hypothetical protein
VDATETGLAPMRVSVRARLAATKACWNRRSSWLPSVPALRAAAHALGWATVLLEGVVALAFLAPPALGIGRLRDAALLVFCAGTYALAPVAGFGWLLLAMGAAQSQSARWRLLYLAVFALVIFYREVPWLGLLVGS